MQSMKNIAGVLPSINNQAKNDYTNDDGLLFCGECHTAKQCMVDGMGIVFCLCDCGAEKRNKEIENRKRLADRQRIGELRKHGLPDRGFYGHTFDHDDGKNPKKTDLCRRYAEHWEDMKKKNVGLLFTGQVGCGKTFYACCIANALIDNGVKVMMTNFTRLINDLQAVRFGENRNDILDRIAHCDLFIIDDLGVERDSEYIREQVYSVIDTRYRSGKPLIVTTNLTADEMQKPASLEQERIFDRIRENCVLISVEGQSRRGGEGAKKRDVLQQLMRSGGEQ